MHSHSMDLYSLGVSSQLWSLNLQPCFCTLHAQVSPQPTTSFVLHVDCQEALVLESFNCQALEGGRSDVQHGGLCRTDVGYVLLQPL